MLSADVIYIISSGAGGAGREPDPKCLEGVPRRAARLSGRHSIELNGVQQLRRPYLLFSFLSPVIRFTELGRRRRRRRRSRRPVRHPGVVDVACYSLVEIKTRRAPCNEEHEQRERERSKHERLRSSYAARNTGMEGSTRGLARARQPPG